MAQLDDPTAQQPGADSESDDQFSPQVRYAGSDVICGNCQYFDGQNTCSNPEVVADMGGQVEAGGRCERFSEGQEQPDELQQSIQNTKPFGPMSGISNS